MIGFVILNFWFIFMLYMVDSVLVIGFIVFFLIMIGINFFLLGFFSEFFKGIMVFVLWFLLILRIGILSFIFDGFFMVVLMSIGSS